MHCCNIKQQKTKQRLRTRRIKMYVCICKIKLITMLCGVYQIKTRLKLQQMCTDKVQRIVTIFVYFVYNIF